MMKISISVPGRFTAFSLAKELYDKGYLHCLVTSYPAFEVKKYGIPADKVKSILSKEIVFRAYLKLTGKYLSGVFFNNWFDLVASRKLPQDSDIYILWAGFASITIRHLRKRNPNALFLIERGSAHIEVQNDLLKMCGVSEQPVHPGVIKKELAEYGLADYIVLGGSFSKRTYIEKGISEKKIFVNNYGVDLTKFNPDDDSGSYQKNDEVFTIGYVGTLDRQKNIRGLLHAAEMLRGRGYKVRLLLAGHIDPREINADELNSLPYVDYRGVLLERKLHELYREMDVFVLNSVQDGFGMVLLQAMAMGVVPIATYNTGGPDVIRHGVNGFLIPILDDLALTDQIEAFIHSGQKETLRKNAKDTVRSGFSWRDYGERAIAFYERILIRS